MIKHGDPNLLNINGIREVTFLPPHFLVMDLTTTPPQIPSALLRNWLYENLDGRFYIQEQYGSVNQIGFEIHSEASYFSLFKDQIGIVDSPF